MTEENTLDNIDFAPPGFKVSPGWRVGHLREETFTKSGLLVPAGSEKTSEALPLICLLYTSPSPRDVGISRMPSSA